MHLPGGFSPAMLARDEAEAARLAPPQEQRGPPPEAADEHPAEWATPRNRGELLMPSRTVCAIQHIACETPGLIAEVLEAEGVAVEYVRPFLQESVPPSLDPYDGLVVMGGPMGVYEQDRYPFLRDEIRLIQAAVPSGKPVLGVCLGSQLLAAALGGCVTRGPRKEIGWFPVTLTPEAVHTAAWRTVPTRFTALHWHGDVFTLPAGAVPLASSDLTRHQAFAYGPAAWGVLFHLEVTESTVAGMVSTFGDELREAAVDGQRILAEAGRFVPGLGVVARTLFGGWADLVRQAPSGLKLRP
jgi:GMP synthase (glutamine-hydrolysing)